MAINPDTLQVRITGTKAMLDVGRSYLTLHYEVFHVPTGGIIAANQVSELVGTGTGFLEADDRLRARVDTNCRIIRWHHTGLDALGGLSPTDAGLCLEHWAFTRDGDAWTVVHPVSGVFGGVEIASGGTFPPLVQRVLAVVGLVLPPPAWSFASSPGIGKLAASCVPVDGADQYKVFNDNSDGTFTLLGIASTAGGGTVDVSPGAYIVRMAGVKDGVVGVLGVPIPVTVEGDVLVAEGVAVLRDARESGRWARLKRWLRDPWGVLPQ